MVVLVSQPDPKPVAALVNPQRQILETDSVRRPGYIGLEIDIGHAVAVEDEADAVRGLDGNLPGAKDECPGVRRRAGRKHDVVRRIGSETGLRLGQEEQSGDREPASVGLQRRLTSVAKLRDVGQIGIGRVGFRAPAAGRHRRYRQRARRNHSRHAFAPCLCHAAFRTTQVVIHL